MISFILFSPLVCTNFLLFVSYQNFDHETIFISDMDIFMVILLNFSHPVTNFIGPFFFFLKAVLQYSSSGGNIEVQIYLLNSS